MPRIARFVARLNAEPASNICYFGDTEAEIMAWMTGGECAPEVGLYTTDGGPDDRITGFMGLEYDVAVGRVWLHGPLLELGEDVEWEATADALMAAALALTPAGFSEVKALVGYRRAR